MLKQETLREPQNHFAGWRYPLGTVIPRARAFDIFLRVKKTYREAVET